MAFLGEAVVNNNEIIVRINEHNVKPEDVGVGAIFSIKMNLQITKCKLVSNISDYDKEALLYAEFISDDMSARIYAKLVASLEFTREVRKNNKGNVVPEKWEKPDDITIAGQRVHFLNNEGIFELIKDVKDEFDNIMKSDIGNYVAVHFSNYRSVKQRVSSVKDMGPQFILGSYHKDNGNLIVPNDKLSTIEYNKPYLVRTATNQYETIVIKQSMTNVPYISKEGFSEKLFIVATDKLLNFI